MDGLMATGLVSRQLIGTTGRGKPIFAYKVSTAGGARANDPGGPKPQVLVVGGVHAREWMGVETAARFAARLVQEHDSSPVGSSLRYLLDNAEVYVVPSLNADGRVHSEEHPDQFWQLSTSEVVFFDSDAFQRHGRLRRKNLDGVLGGTSDVWPPLTSIDSNQAAGRSTLGNILRGTDLNRNMGGPTWGFADSLCNVGVSDIEFSIVYRGPTAGSSPEARALAGLMSVAKLPRLRAVVDIHTFEGSLIRENVSGVPGVDVQRALRRDLRAAELTGVVEAVLKKFGPAYFSKPCGPVGSVDDYAGAARLVPSYTIELATGPVPGVLDPGPYGFVRPNSEVGPVTTQAFFGLRATASWAVRDPWLKKILLKQNRGATQDTLYQDEIKSAPEGRSPNVMLKGNGSEGRIEARLEFSMPMKASTQPVVKLIRGPVEASLAPVGAGWTTTVYENDTWVGELTSFPANLEGEVTLAVDAVDEFDGRLDALPLSVRNWSNGDWADYEDENGQGSDGGRDLRASFCLQRDPIRAYDEAGAMQVLQSTLPLAPQTTWLRAKSLKFSLCEGSGIAGFTLLRGTGTVQEIVLSEVVPGEPKSFAVTLTGDKMGDSPQVYTARLTDRLGRVTERYFVLDGAPPVIDLTLARADPSAGTLELTGAAHDAGSGVDDVVALAAAQAVPGAGPAPHLGASWPPGPASKAVGGTLGLGRFFHLARDYSGLAPAVGGSLLDFGLGEQFGGGAVIDGSGSNCNWFQPAPNVPFFIGNGGHVLKRVDASLNIGFVDPSYQRAYDEGRLVFPAASDFGSVRVVVKSTAAAAQPAPPNAWEVKSVVAPTGEQIAATFSGAGFQARAVSLPLAPLVTARIETSSSPADVTAQLATCLPGGSCATNPVTIPAGDLFPRHGPPNCLFQSASVSGFDEDGALAVPANPMLMARFEVDGISIEADEITTPGTLAVGRVPFAPPRGWHPTSLVRDIALTAGYRPPLRIGFKHELSWPPGLLAKAAMWRFSGGVLSRLPGSTDILGGSGETPGTSLFFLAIKDGIPPVSTAAFVGRSIELPNHTMLVSTRTGVVLSAVDPAVGDDVDTGVRASYYSAAGVFASTSQAGVATFAGTPFTLPEGIVPLAFASEDYVHNVEAATMTIVAVDGTAPTSSLSVSGPMVVESSRVIVGPQTLFSLAAADPVSNGVSAGTAAVAMLINETVESCGLSLDTPPLINPRAAPGSCGNPIYSAPFAMPAGTGTLGFFALDNVFNAEALRSTTAVGDHAPPTVAIASLPQYTNNPRPTFRAAFSDDLAALDTSALTFSVDGTTIPAALVAASTGPLTWLTAPSLPFGVYLHSMLYANGFLYALGGVDAAGVYRTDVSLSAVGPGGVPGAWVPTTPLPAPSVVMGAASTLGRLYVMGGVPGGSTVRYAQVLSTGNLGGWEDAPPLPASLTALEGVAVDAAGSYLYAIGGQDPSNVHQDEVYFSGLDAVTGAPLGWGPTLPLPTPRAGAASCVWNGRIYILGGNTLGDVPVAAVHSSSVQGSGAIAGWRGEAALPFPTFGARAVAVAGRIYVLGGFTNGARTDAVYSAAIDPDGRLGAWRPETALHTPLYFAAAAAPSGAIYYGGGIVGSAGTADVRYALLLPPDAAPKQAELLATPLEPLGDGPHALLARGADRVANARTAIGSITVDLTPPTVTLTAAGVELSSAAERFVTDAAPVLVAAFRDRTSGVDPPTARLFLDGADVTPAPPSATLTLTPASLAPGRHTLEARAADIAGNPVSLAALFFIDADPPSVTLTAPVPGAVYGASVPLAALFSDEGSGLDPATLALSVDATAYASAVRPGPGAAALGWLTAPSLPFGVYLHSMLYANGFLYTLGGVDAAGVYRTDVSLSAVGPGGVPGAWVPTTPLPAPSVVMGAASTLGRLYVMGGVPGGSTVRYAQVLSTGNLGGWEDAPPLPASLTALEGVAVDAAGSYLYAIGGQDPSNVHQDEVYFSGLDAVTGAPLGWGPTLPLPTPRAGAASCVWNRRIYILGGNTLGDVPVATVHSSSVQGSGAIAGWRGEAALPFPTFGARAVAVAGRIYVLGGFTNGARTDAVYSAAIDPDGRLGAWRPETALHTPLYFAAAAAPSGAIYYGGGIVGSAGTADVRYALLAGGSLLASATAHGLAEGGPHAARAQAADRAGNAAFASATFHVDLSPPLTALVVQGASSTAPGLVLATSASTVTLTARDFPQGVNAGVTAAYLAVNGGPLGPAPATLSLSTGTSLLEFWSVDALGHAESTRTVLVTLQDARSVAAAVDGNAGISAAQAVTITTVSAANAPSVYELARDAQGLTSVFPVYYELSGGTFPAGKPALLSFYIDLNVITDTTTLKIFTFNEQNGVWVSSPILNQRFTLLAENYGVFTGELLHTSAYALMRRSIITDPVAPAVAFAFPRPDEPGLCRLAQGPVAVRGSVSDEETASWSVTQGSVLVGSGTANADGTLGVWDATGLSGAFGLALAAQDASGNTDSAALSVQAGQPARVLALGGKEVLNKPRGVAAGPDRVYVADTNADRVRVFDVAGVALAVLGDKKGPAKLNKPAGLALDAAGNILVADANNKRVVKLSPAGVLLAEYGTGVLKRPMAVALSLGRIVVADAKSGQLAVFAQAGPLLARVELPGIPRVGRRGDADDDDDDEDEEEEPRPMALAADAAGNVWVADAEGRRVLRFAPDLTLAQTIPGFRRPEGVAVSPSGACLAVSDAKDARIRTFDAGLSAGLAAFGVRGEIKENRPLPAEFLLNKPAQLAFTADGALLVADRDNDLVQGFGLPGAPVVVAVGKPRRSGHGGTRLSSSGGEDEVVAEARVGRFEGGRVEHPDGAAVEIPAGAVAEDVDVAVAAAPDAGDEHRVREAGRSLAGLAAASAAREFSPHGLTFREPALITLPYDPLLAAAARSLQIHYWNPERSAWEALDSEVDEGARTVSARVAHFSVYQVLAPAGAVSVLADPDSGFAFRASYAFPNPAVGGQKPTVHVAVGRADKVTVRFYDVAGTPVHEATLDTPAVVNDESGPHWAYEYAWNGHIPSGVYIYSVTAEKAGHAPIKRVGKLAVVR